MEKSLFKTAKFWTVFLTGAALLTVSCILFFWEKPREVKVIQFEGDVSVNRTGHSAALAVFEGMRIEPEDTVTTKESSSVTLSVDENKFVRIADNSTVTFEEISNRKSGQITEMHLDKGTIINDVREKLQDNAAYRISTPNATVSIRGTYFTVHVGEAEGYTGLITTINVYQGSVEVETGTGEIAVLYADRNSTMQVTSSLTLPSGNRAIVGIKEITVYDTPDYAHLNADDFERLLEIAREKESVLDIPTIEQYMEQLITPPEEETEDIPAATEPLPPAEPSGTDSNNDARDGYGKNTADSASALLPVSPLAAVDVSANPPLIDLPLSPVKLLPDAPPSEISGGNHSGNGSNSGGNSSSGTPVPPSGGENPPEPDKPTEPEQPSEPETPSDTDNSEAVLKEQQAAYAPVLLTMENYDTVKASVEELSDKIKIWEDSGLPLPSEVAAAKTQVETAAGLLADMDASNLVLEQINNLKYPVQITAADQPAIQAARAAYNSLSGTCRQLIPENMLEKLEKCEAALYYRK